ncbi:MAG: M42 family peptidase [Anaerolineae bacterium]|nr:M42 family peptidase [Anaerolineae bacterium]
MDKFLLDTLHTLSDIPGTSGNETEVRQAIRPLITSYVDEQHTDAMGNLIVLKRGTSKAPSRVLVTAHMDEVGLMVVGYTNDGALRIESIGGINAQILPGLQVLVGKEARPGVIGLQAIHRTKDNDSTNVPDIKSLAVDIGTKDKETAQKLAPLGTPITFATRFRDLGTSITGKAFDDRAGCALLATLLRGDPYPFDLYGAFTVQEEVGLRGASVASYTADPVVAFSLEGTLADDLPKEEKDVSPTAELGKGPAITVKDRSYITPPRLLHHVVETAETEAIPYQIKQPGISGTEAGVTHRARGGVLAITIAVPCRYIHSPISLTRHSDVENTLALIQASLARLDPTTLIEK